MRRKPGIFISCVAVFILACTGYKIVQSVNVTDNETPLVAAKQHVKAAKKEQTVMRQPIDWRLASEKLPYPNVNAHPNLWIKVSLAKQRVYLMDKNNLLYTMYASTGITKNGWQTPSGSYRIEAQRGKYFYAPNVNEGAYDWVSFLQHGVYLFHSVPFDRQGHVIKSAALAQGKSESSHGCIHLTLADAAWFYNNIKFNTKVVIN